MAVSGPDVRPWAVAVEASILARQPKKALRPHSAFYNGGPSLGRVPPGLVSETRPDGGFMNLIERGIH